ncbi:RNA-binding NOB1-like protein [Prosopis cineraria]|uniref:RNA-binding NOB1-like protein n=1 Tax=Prosopis cineraria TaxID=364024 RepID=UPI00240F2A0B|nr:RNA-binding NOB1-like protein [Prosopis cineraria]
MEEAPASAAPSSTFWSNVVKSQQPPKPPQEDPLQTGRVFVESCKSSNGISVAVVDASAIIAGGERLHNCADKFFSVPEVMQEIRDPVSRHRLSFIPFTVETMEPTPEAINKVIKFAKATGDLQTLSDVDLKLIALTYTLEAQIHGTKHLRDIPPPVQVVNVRRLPEKDMPGWGSNVPNLEEWEALEHETEDKSNSNSRILPLQDLNLNLVPQDNHSEDGLSRQMSEPPSENLEGSEYGSRKPRRRFPEKKDINIEGKKMVADGIDASQGQCDDNAGDWMPAVSRSTHRRYLRRKARREALSLSQDQQDLEENIVDGVAIEDGRSSDQLVHQSDDEKSQIENVDFEDSKLVEEKEGSENLPGSLKKMSLKEGSLEVIDGENELSACSGEPQSSSSRPLETASNGDATMATKLCELDTINDESNNFEAISQSSEACDSSYADDDSSEQSWMLRSLCESSVACVTGDFAMQNVLLQMGLRLLAPGGTQIRELHRWILKCHACYTVTAEIGRIFCPKCGNGGTLRKVAVTVDENGVVLAARRPRITLRGTKFSLPLPQGGRDAVTKNLILREDQLPQKLLYPKTKKKANKQDDDFFTPDKIFSHNTDKRAPFQPPVRKALAVFSGKRNPNDNHYSRSKHK